MIQKIIYETHLKVTAVFRRWDILHDHLAISSSAPQPCLNYVGHGRLDNAGCHRSETAAQVDEQRVERIQDGGNFLKGNTPGEETHSKDYQNDDDDREDRHLCAWAKEGRTPRARGGNGDGLEESMMG